MPLINIIANILGTFSGGLGLPYCARSIAVAWFKSFSNLVSGKVMDNIGYETRDVKSGSYISSGIINFHRTTGTFDYVDPSDGSTIEDVSIPSDGLYTIETNGISQITTSDDSYYPVCETAGTVIHDTTQESVHIEVDTPVWAESIYGSDYLNQYGYITKTDATNQGYDYVTTVDSVEITLDDDCLVPLVDWDYVPLFDSNGVQLYDSDGEILYAKKSS